MKALFLLLTTATVLLCITRVSSDAQTLVTRYNPKVGGTPYHGIAADHEGNILLYQHFDQVNGEFVGNLAKLDANGDLAAGFTKVFTNGNISHVKIQNDGKILISGDFTTINGMATPNLVRLNPDGTPDPSFVSALASAGRFDLQSDGKIIVVESMGLVRLNTDGTLDPDFSMTGYFYAHSPFDVGPDDHIYLTTFSQLYRLKPDGADDPDFYVGTGVKENHISSILAQSDGKILIGGFFTEYNGVAANSVVRVLPNGQVDTEFNIGEGPQGQILDMTERANKNILIGGVFSQYAQQPASLVELKPNGSLHKIIAVVSINWITSIIESPDGKVTLAGEFTRVNGMELPFLVKFNTDYTINNSFHPLITYNNPNGRFLEVTKNGKLITGANQDFLRIFDGSNVVSKEIVQLNALGFYDNSFSPRFPTNNPYIVSTALQEDGKVLLGGFVQDFNGPNLVRLNPDGSKDNSFEIGTGPTTGSNLAGMAYKMAVKDDIIYIAGYFKDYNGVASQSIVGVDLNGTIVKTFSALPADSQVNDFALQSDGRIIVIGHFKFPGGDKRVVRLNADGSLDDSFFLASATGNILVVTTDEMDRIYFGGSFMTMNGALSNSLVRLLPDGNLDTSFDIQAGFDDNVLTLALLPEGHVAAGGYFKKFNNEVANGFLILDQTGARVPAPSATFGNKSVTVKLKYLDGSLYLAGRYVKDDYTDVYGVAKISIAPVTLPADPDGLSVALDAPGKLQLRWNDNSLNELAFVVERSVGSEAQFTTIDTLHANTITMSDDGIEGRVEYRYRLKAEGDAGASGYSNVASYTWIPAPVAQLNLTVTEQGENEILLSWTGAVSYHDGFIIERSESPASDFVVVDTVSASTKSYIDIVEVDKTYFYKVAAYNIGGTTFSNEVSMIISGVEMGEASVSIFPVPADEFISVQTSVLSVGGQWRLLTLTGQQIELTAIETFDGLTRIDVQQVPSGIYFMQYIRAGSLLAHHRIAVHH